MSKEFDPTAGNSRLVAWMYREKMTQQELADRIGIGREMVSRCFGKRSPWSLKSAMRIERLTDGHVLAKWLSPDHPDAES